LLSAKDEQPAQNYLVSLGISSDRISTITFGKEKPLDPGHHEEAWAKIEGPYGDHRKIRSQSAPARRSIRSEEGYSMDKFGKG